MRVHHLHRRLGTVVHYDDLAAEEAVACLGIVGDERCVGPGGGEGEAWCGANEVGSAFGAFVAVRAGASDSAGGGV